MRYNRQSIGCTAPYAKGSNYSSIYLVIALYECVEGGTVQSGYNERIRCEGTRQLPVTWYVRVWSTIIITSTTFSPVQEMNDSYLHLTLRCYTGSKFGLDLNVCEATSLHGTAIRVQRIDAAISTFRVYKFRTLQIKFIIYLFIYIFI